MKYLINQLALITIIVFIFCHNSFAQKEFPINNICIYPPKVKIIDFQRIPASIAFENRLKGNLNLALDQSIPNKLNKVSFEPMDSIQQTQLDENIFNLFIEFHKANNLQYVYDTDVPEFLKTDLKRQKGDYAILLYGTLTTGVSINSNDIITEALSKNVKLTTIIEYKKNK